MSTDNNDENSPRRNRRRPARNLNHLTRASIIGISEVGELTTLSRATIYRMMKAKAFPSNRKLNTNRAGWRLGDVLDWLDKLR